MKAVELLVSPSLRRQLEAIAAEVGSYREFADAVVGFDPVLGATACLHAEAADGNSPPLEQWPAHTMDDWREIQAAGISTPDEARTWWERKYGRA